VDGAACTAEPVALFFVVFDGATPDRHQRHPGSLRPDTAAITAYSFHRK